MQEQLVHKPNGGLTSTSQLTANQQELSALMVTILQLLTSSHSVKPQMESMLEIEFNNAIYRLEAEETGDNTGVFEGSMEYTT